MNVQERFPDVTDELLAGFSPYIASIVLDLPTNSIEFHLLDRVESPTALRVLRFERLQSLEITPHNPDDIDPLFMDSIIGAQRQDMAFYFHTERFAISFRCAVLGESTASICDKIGA